MPDDISITWTSDRPDLTINGVRFICRPQEEEPQPWHFPVGEGAYPPERWYCSVWHDPTGALNGGYEHTGIDLNLDVSPWGDVERALGLGIYTIAPGAVHYMTRDWYGVPMVVIRHEHDGLPLFVRYAHIRPHASPGEIITAGDRLGGFANWRRGDGGDHLHLDMSRTAYTTEWFTPGMLDPVPIFKAHLDPVTVDAMLRKG